MDVESLLGLMAIFYALIAVTGMTFTFITLFAVASYFFPR